MSEQIVKRGRRRRFRYRPLKKEYLLGKIHNRDSQTFMRKIPANFVSLTLTRPPTPDDVILAGRSETQKRPLWNNYEEYLQFMGRILRLLYRVTKDGGMAVISCENIPIVDEEGAINGYYPVVADITNLAISHGWKLWDQIVVVQLRDETEDKLIHYAPNVQNSKIHSNLLVFKRSDKNRRCKGKRRRPHYLNSVWTIDGYQFAEVNGKKIKQFSEHLVKRVFALWSCIRDVVFDPFAGTGQILRVAKKYRRLGFGVEIDSNYMDHWTDLFDITDLQSIEEENKKSREEITEDVQGLTENDEKELDSSEEEIDGETSTENKESSDTILSVDESSDEESSRSSSEISDEVNENVSEESESNTNESE